MKINSISVRRSGSLTFAVGFITALLMPLAIPSEKAYAGVLSSRKIQLASSDLGNISSDANGTAVPAGQGGNGAQTSHTFTFTPTTATIGGILFQYCDTPFTGTACNVPSGMDASTVNAITNPQNVSGGAFSRDTTTSGSAGWFATNGACAGTAAARTNCVLISRATPASETAVAKSFTFGASGGWLKNPTTAGTYYVRIVTFSDNTFTTAVDNGTVAFAVSNDIDITAKIQEQLKMGVSSTTNAPTASCVALPAGSSLTLGSAGVLSASAAYDTRSYIRVSTNSANGTVVQYTGNTLRTAAGDTINVPAGMATTPATPTVGTEQFGLGFDSGDATPNGWSVTHLTTRPSPYNSANGVLTSASFGFNTSSITAPVTIASSANVVNCDTLSVRYVANISATTEPGVYRTNIGYIATPMY